MNIMLFILYSKSIIVNILDLEIAVLLENPMIKIHEDAFLYHIEEAYSARLKKDGTFTSHFQYRPFLEKSWVLPKAANAAKLRQEMTSIFEHHSKISPLYKSTQVVNSLNIAEFSHALACLIFDLNFLLKSFTGHAIPKLVYSQIKTLRTTAAINAAIKKFKLESKKKDISSFKLFPIDTSLDETQSRSLDIKYSCEIWSMLATSLAAAFSTPFKNIILDYFIWKFYYSSLNGSHDEANKEDLINWKTRPPCGIDYYKKFGDPYAVIPISSKFNKGKTKSNDHQNKDKKVNHNKRPHQGSFKTKDHEFKKETHNVKNRDSSSLKKKELIEAAINEVKSAIERLKNKKNLKEVHLKPQNSFYRMQQHTHCAKEGYRSESQGSEIERHVCLFQKRS